MGQSNFHATKAAYDEVMPTAGKRQLDPRQVVGDLPGIEINAKQARSIKYRMTIAKLPLAKEADDFDLQPMPANETPVRGLADGNLPDHQRTEEKCRARRQKATRI